MGFLSGARRVILWDFARGSWQYDIIVVAILAFIFLTPREFFRDQPRMFSASDVVMLPPERGVQVYWMDPELLNELDEAAQMSRAETLIRQRSGRAEGVARVEPVLSDGELRGYMVFVKP